MNGRVGFGYVVSIEGQKSILNLKDAYRGHIASHSQGVSMVTEVGGLFGVDGGTRLLIMRVRSLSFLEPREAHRAGVGSTSLRGEPLRYLEAVVVGFVERRGGTFRFIADSLISPALGAEAFPLSRDELASILGGDIVAGDSIRLGEDVRGGGTLKVSVSDLLGRHVAVLGGTGQGKSCFTAAVLQQLLSRPNARIVVFDINGEYEQALTEHAIEPGATKVSVIGGNNPSLRIPYVALGRHGLARLLSPSEKTQRPALNFAIESLPFVEWDPLSRGVALVGQTASLFDDCRPGSAQTAANAIEALRKQNGTVANRWPNMQALGCLAAESYCLQQGRNGYERSSFLYGNLAPLISRIRRYVEDPLFTSVIDVDGVASTCQTGGLNWAAESESLVKQIFGDKDEDWRLHILNLRHVAHDLLPMVLGSLLELLAFEMFRKGQGETHPTLIVLEEAHHYLRQNTLSEDGTQHMLAYERLAKEGRKFGISLWISTQRPSEISSTVLAQCGTWAVFRLTSESDLRAVGAAGEWLDRQELSRIAGLPRQQAVVFGSSVVMPTRVVAPVANPLPKSADPDFSVWSLVPNAATTTASQNLPQ